MHRYNLEHYKSPSSRHRCPGCNKNKTFAFYIDAETSEPVHDRVGRCNREIECAYHYTPSQYFKENGINIEHTPYTPPAPKPQPPASFIDPVLFKKSLSAYRANNFVMFLNTLFNQQTVNDLIRKYLIGTSNHWPGATVFWQADEKGLIRTGKVMLYNPSTGKRIKEPFNHFHWAHKVLNLPEFNLKQCLFGEHLLKNDPQKPVAIVESEKTALIASVYLPQYIWLAVGGLSQLSMERCKALKGRNVVLYPDLNAFDIWLAKGNELGFKTSSILESRATEQEKSNGLDIADYLLKVNLAEVRPKLGDIREVSTKAEDQVHETDRLAKNVLKQTNVVSTKADVLELRDYYQNLDECGFIIEESADISGIGLIPNLRIYIGELWQFIQRDLRTDNLAAHIIELKLIRQYYSKFGRTGVTSALNKFANYSQ